MGAQQGFLLKTADPVFTKSPLEQLFIYLFLKSNFMWSDLIYVT
jgi:hypothetical protein